MKKFIYIVLVMVLLLLVSIITHNLLISCYGEVQTLRIIVVTICVIGGFGLGQYWWQYLYVDKKYIPKCKWFRF